jgi:hypothetical protein
MSIASEPTARAIEALKAIGLLRASFSVRTPYDKKKGCYGETLIMVFDRDGLNKVYAGSAALVSAGYHIVLRYLPDAPETEPTNVSIRRSYTPEGSLTIQRFSKDGNGVTVLPLPPVEKTEPEFVGVPKNTTLDKVAFAPSPRAGHLFIYHRKPAFLVGGDMTKMYLLDGGTAAVAVFVPVPPKTGVWTAMDAAIAVINPVVYELDNRLWDRQIYKMEKGEVPAVKWNETAFGREAYSNPLTPVLYATIDLSKDSAIVPAIPEISEEEG